MDEAVRYGLSAIGGGIVIHLAAAYLKPVLDSTFARSWMWWRNRSESAKREYQELVAALAADPVELASHTADEMRDRLSAITFILEGIMFMILLFTLQDSGAPGWVQLSILAVGAFVFLFGMTDLTSAMRKWITIRDARRRRLMLAASANARAASRSA